MKTCRVVWYCFYVYCISTYTRVQTHDLHSWGLIGKCLYYPKLRYIQTTILHNVQSQHFVREKAGGRKWDDQMGEWSGARGCPENGMWVDGGKAWPGIRAWMNVRVECGSHGNGEMEMGSKMVQFIDHDIYKHNIPPLLENKIVIARIEMSRKSWIRKRIRVGRIREVLLSFKIYTNALNISLREEE